MIKKQANQKAAKKELVAPNDDRQVNRRQSLGKTN